MRIDAHHHVWRVARGDYGWLTPDLPICRDYGLDDLRPLLGDVTATVLVQAAPTEAETLFLLDAARQSGGLVRGVVGWADLAAPDSPARIASLARDGLLKGMRPMLQDLPVQDWILREELRPALAAIAANGLAFDALVRPAQLPAILTLARRHPALRIVIDHAAKPDIAHAAWQPWADDIARIAHDTSVFCKLSGLVTEAAPDWQAADLQRYVAHVLATFGPERVMWGSDWPVVDLAGGYARWREATTALLQSLPAPARDAVLGDTARVFYRLES